MISVLVFSAIVSCSKDSTSPSEITNPTNLQLVMVENDIVKLTWQDNSDNEIKFFIDRKIGEYDWYENYGEVEANITAFTDEIQTNSNIIYSYKVRSFDGENYSEYSIVISWFSDYSTPYNLQIEQIEQDSLRISWYDNSIGEEGFRVDRKIGNESWNDHYREIPPNLTFFIDYNPTLYDTCYYRVYAFSGNTYSNYTQNNYTPVLLAPSNLEIEPLSGNMAKLTWNDNSEGEEGYIVHKMIEEGNWDSVTIAANSVEWIDNNVTPGILNYYKICSFIGNFYSPYIEININTLPSPSNLNANVVDEIKIYLTWDDNSNYEEGFLIYRKAENEEYELLETLNENTISYIDENVENLVTYYYQICGFIQTNCTAFSNEVNSTCYQGFLLVPDNYPSIQSAIDASVNYDIVLVKPGTYYENINYNGKLINVTSLFTIINNYDYVDQTIINGNDQGSVVSFINNESPLSVLQGFTITNGNGTQDGNWAYGGGIYCNNSSNPTIKNVLIINNGCNCGGGIYISTQSNPYLENITITDNYAQWGDGIFFDSNFPQQGSATILNCIIWSEVYFSGSFGGELSADYSDINYYSVNGDGNINEDPQFVNTYTGNYRLNINSPCIDAGNPDSQYNDPDGSRNDMGAFGGTNGNWQKNN